METITQALHDAGVIPKDAYLDHVHTRCYCEDGAWCDCFPETFTYTQAVIVPNTCPTCGATGDSPCQTPSGKRVRYHRKRHTV